VKETEVEIEIEIGTVVKAESGIACLARGRLR
jgi:hypothetical protein